MDLLGFLFGVKVLEALTESSKQNNSCCRHDEYSDDELDMYDEDDYDDEKAAIKRKTALKIARRMYDNGEDIQTIAEYTGLDEEYLIERL